MLAFIKITFKLISREVSLKLSAAFFFMIALYLLRNDLKEDIKKIIFAFQDYQNSWTKARFLSL